MQIKQPMGFLGAWMPGSPHPVNQSQSWTHRGPVKAKTTVANAL